MEAFFILIFIFSHLTCSDASFAVDLQCPERFQNGENIVTCTINSTAVREAECLSVSESVTFDRTIDLQTTAVCMYTYDPNQKCMPPVQNSPGSCWCNSSSNGIFTYTFSYLADSKRDQGGQLECKICIFPEKNFNLNVSKSCRSMSFDEHKVPITDSKQHNSSVVGAHTNEKAGKDPKSDGSDDPNNPAVIGGIIGGVVILIIAVILLFLCYKKYQKRSRSASKKDKSSEANSKDEGIHMLNKEEKDAPNHQTGSGLKKTDDSSESLRSSESKDKKERDKTEEKRAKNQQNGTASMHV